MKYSYTSTFGYSFVHNIYKYIIDIVKYRKFSSISFNVDNTILNELISDIQYDTFISFAFVELKYMLFNRSKGFSLLYCWFNHTQISLHRDWNALIPFAPYMINFCLFEYLSLCVINGLKIFTYNCRESLCFNGSARLLIAIRTEITDNVEISTEKNGNYIFFNSN